MITLDDDETMLLLITKHHAHKDVISDAQLGSIEYIQDCCNYRCFGSGAQGADVFHIYLPLCEKVLSPAHLCSILAELHKNEFWVRLGMPARTLMDLIIGALATRHITDLVLDESLMKGATTNANLD